jgi:hypothetical protein
MTRQKRKKDETHPVNFILLAISLIIFGVLGIIFITQMELIPGWIWGTTEEHSPLEYKIQLTDDKNGDGIPDIVSWVDIEYCHDEGCDQSPNFGGVYLIDGKSGLLINKTEYVNPVKKVFQIPDINGNGADDYFIVIAAVKNEWKETEWDKRVEVIPNNFSNFMIDGQNLTPINILTGDFLNFTNNYVFDVLSFNDFTDDLPDFIILEAQYLYSPFDYYILNISTYFANGTKVDSNFVGDFHYEREGETITPSLQFFDYNGEQHILYVSTGSISLLNTSSEAFLSKIYEEPISAGAEKSVVIEDINSDSFYEIVTTSSHGNVSIINGADGQLIRSFQIDATDGYVNISDVYVDLKYIPSDNDGQAYILLSVNIYGDVKRFDAYIFKITNTEQTQEWFHTEVYEDNNPKVFVLGEDFDGDLINEILVVSEYIPFLSQNNVNRYQIISFPSNIELLRINIDYNGNSIITINDFDGDGKKDFAIDGDRITALSSSKPTGIWLSSAFSLGIPLFITLCGCLIIGAGILGRNAPRIKLNRQRLKKTRLAVTVNIIVIALMTISIAMFLMQLNVFNRTLITGEDMTSITVIYLTITIIWYGLLPLTAAVYNGFSPQFAYMFIKLREIFFRISKNYEHDIIVEDMSDRQDLSTIVRLKRVILPLLLSIAVAFYSYNTLAPLLGYPQGFDNFGSSEFFKFIIGYNLLCLLPMILTFFIFSFFISGNYLLDDAGIVYYLKSKTHRRPGDIEPISIWAQSIIKGIAGLSALITFSSFLSTVDFSGFFNTGGEGGIISLIFGFFLVIVMFWGTPFLTAFSYCFFAIEVMDFSLDFNKQKLYYFMEEGGYDTTPRNLTNIYPEGIKSLKEPSESD